MSNLDSLLDATLDDLADLPSFKPFAPGAHRVTASFGLKEINGVNYVELNFKMVESIELEDKTAEMPKEGDTSNTMFKLGNEFGEGNLKKCAAPFAEALNLSTLRDVIEQVQDVECIIFTGIRTDKKDPDKKYLQVKELEIV